MIIFIGFMEAENNIKNKENQEEIPSNNNKQSEEYLKNFKNEVQSIIEKYQNNFASIDELIKKIFEDTKKYLSEYKDLAKIGDTISKIVQGNQDYAFYIIDGFAQGCISAEKKPTDIGDTISKIVINNPNSALNIARGFTQGWILAGKKPTDISDKISKIVRDNPDFAINIVGGFTIGFISRENILKDKNIGNVITKIINTDGIKNKQGLVLNIIDGFTQGCILKGKDLTKIGDTISKIVQGNPDLVSYIIDAFTQGCISQENNLKHEDIGDIISEIVTNNPNSASNIVDGFTQGCILKEKDLTDISNTISKIVEKNPNSAFDIVNGFTQGCISAGKKPTDISDKISKIIKDNPNSALNIVYGFTKGCFDKGQKIEDIFYVVMMEIIETDGIKGNKTLVRNISDGFKLGCISQENDLEDEDIGNKISKIVNKNQNSAFDIVNGFTQCYIVREKDLTKIGNTISKIIQGNPDFALNIVYGFTKGCFDKNIEDIDKIISTITETNPDLKSNITDGFELGRISQKQVLEDEDINKISEIVKKNPNSASNIIDRFTQCRIDKNQTIEDIGNVITKIINTDEIKDNKALVLNIIDSFTQGCILKGKDLTEIGNTISEIVQGNPDFAFYIAYGFTKGCISAGKNLKDKDISDTISKIVKGNPDSAFYIVNGFTKGYISQENNLKHEDIGDTISEIVKGNPDSADDIIDGFTQGYINQNKNIKDIDDIISTIINTNGIKGNQDLVFNIVDIFVKICLVEKPDNIKDIAESFSNSLNGMEDKTKEKLKPIFSLIVSQYFMNTLINSSKEQSSEDNKKTEEQSSEDNKKETDSSNEQSSEDNKKEETETQLFNCYKELFHVENEQRFQDISLKELSDLQDKYLEERFKKKGVDAGTEYETFLKMACNLILKSEGNKELTVTDLENKKDIFKDFKFIYLNNKDGIESKEQLFGKIGLTENDFGTKRESKGSDFSIVYCAYLNHGFVMIIDKTQEWNDAINSETESIYLIDSSRRIEDRKTNGDTLLNVKEQIFKNTPTLNNHSYQENGTCWLNTMSAIGFLLEKQQEQVKQTDQQVTKPYGLSIDELLKGFGKKRDDKSGKITKSATTKKELSLFEQGICDYSTEHFYTLTNISDTERDIIKKFLAEKVEQNKTSEKKILKLFSELEESNFIIEYSFLIESIERFKQDAKRLEELCTKFNIDYTTLSESERKEDSSNKKRKYNIFSSCIPDNKEGQNPKNIKKQNETCCTIF